MLMILSFPQVALCILPPTSGLLLLYKTVQHIDRDPSQKSRSGLLLPTYYNLMIFIVFADFVQMYAVGIRNCNVCVWVPYASF